MFAVFRLAAVAAALLVPSASAAQQSSVPIAGGRVRVTHRCKISHDQVTECRAKWLPQRVTGELRPLDGDTLHMLSQSGAEFAIPVSAVTQTWIVDGKKGNFWTGAGIGFLGGAVLGGVIGSTQEISWFGYGNGPATAIGVLVGAPGGFLLGGVIGATMRSDRWRRASLVRDRLSVEPRLDAIGLNVLVAF